MAINRKFDDDDLPGEDESLSRRDFLPVRALPPMGTSKIVWNEQGLPEIVNTPLRSEEGMKKLTHALLSSPYEGHICDETGEMLYNEEFAGMTQAEAIQRILISKALSGSIKSAEVLFDRAYGKPKQQNENVNVNVTYEDFLDNLAKQDMQLSPDTYDHTVYESYDEDPHVIDSEAVLVQEQESTSTDDLFD
jgi:hypothetical protein